MRMTVKTTLSYTDRHHRFLMEKVSQDDAVSALALEPGLEVLTSRGIPEAEDWTR